MSDLRERLPRAVEIRDAQLEGENTAERIGTLFYDVIDDAASALADHDDAISDLTDGLDSKISVYAAGTIHKRGQVVSHDSVLYLVLRETSTAPSADNPDYSALSSAVEDSIGNSDIACISQRGVTLQLDKSMAGRLSEKDMWESGTAWVSNNSIKKGVSQSNIRLKQLYPITASSVLFKRCDDRVSSIAICFVGADGLAISRTIFDESESGEFVVPNEARYMLPVISLQDGAQIGDLSGCGYAIYAETIEMGIMLNNISSIKGSVAELKEQIGRAQRVGASEWIVGAYQSTRLRLYFPHDGAAKIAIRGLDCDVYKYGVLGAKKVNPFNTGMGADFDSGWLNSDSQMDVIGDDIAFIGINIARKNNAELSTEERLAIINSVYATIGDPGVMDKIDAIEASSSYDVIDGISISTIYIQSEYCQGCCYDGTDVWLYLNTQKRLLRYNLAANTFTALDGVDFGHGNSLAYNSKSGLIYAAKNTGSTPSVVVFSPSSLQVVDTISIQGCTGNISSIAYNAKMDRYVVIDGETYQGEGITPGYVRKRMHILDRFFNIEKSLNIANDYFAMQGIDCDDDYIYLCKSIYDGSHHDIIEIIDWNGKTVNKISVGSGEIEEIALIGDANFIMAKNVGADGRGIYMASITARKSVSVAEVLKKYQPN